MQSFNQLALQRRSIRKYKDQPVEQDKLDLVLQVALASPSGKHLNPWEFVVVTDKQQLAEMSECRTYGSQLLKNAPVGIVLAVDSTIADTWQCDGAIAALNMLLAAEDLGLGGCWVQIYNRGLKDHEKQTEQLTAEQMIREMLGIPEHLNILCVVALGYKDEEKKTINPEKLQYNKIHYGKY